MISSAIIPQPLARLPWRLIWLVLAICSIGLITLYSAAGGSASPWALKQAIMILVFLAIAIAMSWLPENFIKQMTFPAYVVILVLLIIAVQIAYESVLRLMSPVPIVYGEAIAVASLGLCVNLASAWLLAAALAFAVADRGPADERSRPALRGQVAEEAGARRAAAGRGHRLGRGAAGSQPPACAPDPARAQLRAGIPRGAAPATAGAPRLAARSGASANR